MKLLGLIFVIFLSVEFIGFNLDLEDISTKPDRNIIPEMSPTSQTYQFDSNNYKFNISEKISRSFDWSKITSSNITYEVPTDYNITYANISLNVYNDTIQENVVSSGEGGRSMLEQAQSFEITEDSYLINISLYLGNPEKNAIIQRMEIRNNTFNGTVLHSFEANFTSNGWFNVSMDPILFLETGTYYLWMESQGGYQSLFAWWYSDTANETETWILDGTWALANFDLTLKTYTSNIITPEDVNLQVEDKPVTNDGVMGLGHTNFTGTINNTLVSLKVTADSGVSFIYFVSSTCYRNTSSTPEFNIIDDKVYWNLSLGLSHPGSNYTDYSALISGFNPDHYEIRVNNGSVPVIFLDEKSILITAIADELTYWSYNSITNLYLPNIVYTDEIIPIFISVLDEGNVTVEIRSINDTLIYLNSSIFAGTVNFLWYIPPSIEYGNYSATAFYSGEGKVGQKTINFTLLYKAYMSCEDVTGYSFDNLSIISEYIDAFSGLPIEDASMNYSVSGITEDMVYGVENYTGILDLIENPILPGSYLGTCSVIKEGYNPIVTNFNLNILPRNISVIISNNVSTVFLGENLGINISIVDNRDVSIVKIPIDLELKIIKDTDEDEENIVLVETLDDISQSANFSWIIPSNLDVGQYKIMVTSKSVYYEGSSTLNDAFTLFNKASMKCTDVTAFVFENVTLECRYYDVNTNQPIENASMIYKILDIEGSMEFDSEGSGNYSKILDLDLYAFRPGTYSISCSAMKEGYPLLISNFNLIVNPREIILDLSISSSSVFPGESIELVISLKDQVDNDSLKRPLNVEIKIVRNSNGVTEEIVFLSNISGVSSQTDFTWEVPLNLERGEFDIIISAHNDYYSGFFVYSKSLEVKFIVWWVYLIIALGSLGTASGTFIFTQRVRTKRSVKGMLLLHKSGIPLAQEMVHGTLKYNPMLFSGAISGVIALIKEITGQKLHTMEIEGGFLNIIKGEHALLVLILEKNPLWIKDMLQKCFDGILNDYGKEIEDFKGATLNINLNAYAKSYFGVNLTPEDDSTDNELEGRENNQNLKPKGFMNADGRSLKKIKEKLLEKNKNKRNPDKLDA